MPSIEQLFLMTADLEATRSFYEDGLALEPAEIGDTSIAYETAGSELKVQADFPPDVLDSYNISPPPEEGRGAGAVYVFGVHESLETVHERLSTAVSDGGGEILQEPQEVPWGGRILLVRDPNGYVLELRNVDNSVT
ncbi:VOC family protein [Natrinema gelatinilyticum]|uniref:VOC family protein n=1 Tax=Natrinema gelatinilyticum TaxID=2961571 RepID=UPI0020C3D898|nr:VOC family protein [Natrinema gelatinilyticum]